MKNLPCSVRMVESLPGLPEAVKPWDEIKAVMFGEVGTPDQWKGWCFLIKGTTFLGWACLENTLGRQKKRQPTDRF